MKTEISDNIQNSTELDFTKNRIAEVFRGISDTYLTLIRGLSEPFLNL